MPIHTATRPAAPVSRSAAERARPARAAAQLAARPGKPLPPIARQVLRQLQARVHLPRQLRPAAAPVSSHAPVQRTVADDANAIRAQRNTTHDSVLRKILNEVIQTYEAGNVTSRWGPSAQSSHMGPSGTHGVNRAYEVVIDQNRFPDNTTRESVLAHELIHASADHRYAFNRRPGRGPNDSALNVLHDPTRPDEEQYQRQSALRHEVLWRLKAQVERDRATLGDALADHLLDRLDRAIGAPTQEFDTVLTELFYYLSKAAPGHAGTGTFREIRRGADAAYNARHNQTPFATSYRGDLKGLRLQRERREAKDYLTYDLRPVPGAQPAFGIRNARAQADLDAARSATLRSIFDQALRDLAKINLAALGAQATTIATAQSLDTRRHQVAGLSIIQDIYTVKAWIFEAQKKYAASWFGWSLKTAIINLQVILKNMSALFATEEKGVRHLAGLVPFE